MRLALSKARGAPVAAAQIWVDNTDIFRGALAAMGIEETAAE